MIKIHVKEIQKQSNGHLNLLVQQKKKIKRQSILYKTQHRKRKTAQHEPRPR